jgi:hypothetical protein
VADPVERVHAIRRSSLAAKAMSSAVRARTIQSVGELAPPLLLNVASRAMWATNLAGRVPMPINSLVANVPGPPIPLYSCGAKVGAIYSASVLAGAMGVNFTVLSYQDRVDFGITVDPDLVRNPWDLADGIPLALAEIMNAAGLGSPTPITDPCAPSA